MATRGKGRAKKATKLTFYIDVSIPTNDGIMEPSSFENWLRNHIKVNDKAGVLGDSVHITRDKTRIEIKASAPFSKKYLKYLTKKYLKKQKLRDFLRVLHQDKDSYKLQYFHLGGGDDEEDSE